LKKATRHPTSLSYESQHKSTALFIVVAEKMAVQPNIDKKMFQS
jgi:hypothetical protein